MPLKTDHNFGYRFLAAGLGLLGFAGFLFPGLVEAGQNSGAAMELGPVRNARLPVPDIPIARWLPDGRIPLWKSKGVWQMYLAGHSTYRAVGLRTESLSLSPSRAVLNPGHGSFDNGGAWLYSVRPLSDSHLVGFYHAEDHQWEGGRDPDGVAWKSIARCESRDGGLTWTKTGPILTSSKPKPLHSEWGGNGDHCVVFDPASRRWFCFFQEHALCMAVSDHPEGAAGTWKKWYRGSFSEPGLGGKNSPIPELNRYPGGNPSVHFNSFLQCWVMIWHTWSGDLVWSTSRDLERWRRPELLLAAKGSERLWYPTIVGTSDTAAGERAILYYAYWPDRHRNERQFLERMVRFVRPGQLLMEK